LKEAYLLKIMDKIDTGLPLFNRACRMLSPFRYPRLRSCTGIVFMLRWHIIYMPEVTLEEYRVNVCFLLTYV